MSIMPAINHQIALKEDCKAWCEETALIFHSPKNTMLTAELARLSAYKALMAVCKVRYECVVRINAEFISPSGQQPFLKLGKRLFGSFRGLIRNLQECNKLWVNNKDSHQNFLSTGELDTLKQDNQGKSDEVADEEHRLQLSKHTDVAAYIAYVENVLGNAELYWTWFNPSYHQKTNKIYGARFSWPLSLIIPRITREKYVKKLSTRGWTNKPPEEVTEETNICIDALNMKLGMDQFFGGSSPNELDALIYGHIEANYDEVFAEPQRPDNDLDDFDDLDLNSSVAGGDYHGDPTSGHRRSHHRNQALFRFFVRMESKIKEWNKLKHSLKYDDGE